MRVNCWEKCFLCLNNFNSGSTSSSCGEKKSRGRQKQLEIKEKPNFNVLITYLLGTWDQNKDDSLLQRIRQLQLPQPSSSASSAKGSIEFCDKCQDSARRISHLHMELEVVQMKIVDILCSVRKTVIGNSNGSDGTPGLSLEEFTEERQEILNTLYAFQTAVVEKTKESVHVPLVYIEKFTGCNLNTNLSDPAKEDNFLIKTEPNADSLEEILSDFGGDGDGHELDVDMRYLNRDSMTMTMEFSSFDSNNDINADVDATLPPLSPQAMHDSPLLPPKLGKPLKSKSKLKKTVKSRKGEKSSTKEARSRSMSNQKFHAPPSPPVIIKEEQAEFQFRTPETSSSTSTEFQLLPEDVKTESLLTSRRSAATAALQRMSDVKHEKAPRKQLVPPRAKKRHPPPPSPPRPQHPHKIHTGPVKEIKKVKKSAKKSQKPKRVKVVYRCDLCSSYHTECSFRFEQHLRTHETELKSFVCDHSQCQKRFSGKQYYNYHQEFHSGLSRRVCEFCREPIDRACLHDHYLSHTDKVFQCRCCSYCCTTREKYISHTRYHGTRTLVCDICEKPCKTRRLFYLHLHNEHKAVEKIKCDIGNCDKEFFDPSLLHHHKKGHGVAFKCPDCDIIFAKALSLEVHITKRHVGKAGFKFKCDACPESFALNSELQTHKMVVHGAPKLKCDLCDKEYCNTSSLRCHQNVVHHKDAGYSCDQCGKVYGSTYLLRVHQISHSETKNFICEECGKGFAKRQHFKRHLQTHGGEKIHKCSYCPKAFVFRKYLICHLRIHTGERPYVCELCGKDFNQKAALWMHNKSQHKDVIQTK